jgi:hypothetical protein
MDERDRLEVGPDAAWALYAENKDASEGGPWLGWWLGWRECPRGERMAALYGFGEVRA